MLTLALRNVQRQGPWRCKEDNWLHNDANFLQRWWYGTPTWAMQAEAGLAGAGLAPGKPCDCGTTN